MEWEDLARELSQQTDSKIVLLVMDGVGGLPADGKSELEAARKPNLDALAKAGVCGVSDPVLMGITPGSGPAHLALFGYDPLKYRLGRGILEALGSGVEVGRNDLVARGNFATVQGGLVVDRRAGRIPTEENVRICEYLNGRLPKREGVEVRVFPGKEHRFVARFTAEGLADALTDADPQKEGQAPVPTAPVAPEAAKASAVVNRFLEDVAEVLKGEAKANAALLRGFSKFPSIPTMRSCSSSGRRPSPTTPCTRAWPSCWAWTFSPSGARRRTSSTPSRGTGTSTISSTSTTRRPTRRARTASSMPR